ncbi:inositol monophosphatase family protein [Georgenia sp. 10Sc9-8]|uniref:Inositol-1-monophosphatase n=1 Tax=Georgenia halotolerans TaxID=3028317 RepID=A0ABT5U3T3_9MICO|nr:inositol monophosphatase family protein [Georgenia halotolerans]
MSPDDPTTTVPTEQVRALMDLAERVARRAGHVVTDRREGLVEVASTKSSATDVVTAVDEESEELLRAEILAARPDDAILGEEGGSSSGTSGLTWVVDPIDGTVNYLYGLDSYSVSVAVVAGPPDPELWTLLAGCVHAPAMGTTWSAGRGLGAWRNGTRLVGRSGPPLAEALVGTGFGYTPEGRRREGAVVAEMLPQVRDIRRLGSAAVDLCLVADGRLDAYYESGLNAWDMAAGALVVAEAGGTVRGLGDRRASTAMTIAGPAELADALARSLADVVDR